MLIARHIWSAPLAKIGVDSTSPWISIAVGIAIMLLITAGNILAIARNVRGTFPWPHRKNS